jgi:hypothetical protein
MNDLIFPAMGAGVSAGAILLFLSHIAPRFGAGNFVRDLDQPVLFGRHITRREAHFVGIFVYLVFSLAFGGMYAFLVSAGIVSGFQLLPILGWSLILTIVSGGIILPLEGHGLFGVKEDAWFPVDLIITYIFWGILYWWLMSVWFIRVG